VAACGLDADAHSAVSAALRAVISTIAEWTDTDVASWDDIVSLMTEDVEAPMHALLEAAGFEGVADALTTLVLAGMLTTQGAPTDLNIRVDPVLAAALARATVPQSDEEAGISP
jgi:hypothetical protein